MRTPRPGACQGFSLVELLIALAIMLLVTGGAFALMVSYQRSYASNVLQSNLHAGLRSATDLLAQEVSQAGLLSFAPTTLTAAVTGGASAQTVSVGSTAGMFIGEKLLIDVGTSQETVTITGVGSSTVTAIIPRTHASGALVAAVGVFPQGILSSSTATQLRMFGDINANGTLVYVRYDCSAAAGTLSRSVTPITAATSTPAVVLVTGVTANPGGTACFRYTSTTVSGYTFITSVSLTLTARTTQVDPGTRQFVSETKTFNGLSARNVLAGLALATAGLTGQLQATPPGIPLS